MRASLVNSVKSARVTSSDASKRLRIPSSTADWRSRLLASL